MWVLPSCSTRFWDNTIRTWLLDLPVSEWLRGGFIILGVVLFAAHPDPESGIRPGRSDRNRLFSNPGRAVAGGTWFGNHIAMTLAVSLSGLMYYAMLYQTRLVPRWLSGWGLVGNTLTIFATLLVMFRLIGIITTSYLVLNFPMALQEMVLAAWLIVKGFCQAESLPNGWKEDAGLRKKDITKWNKIKSKNIQQYSRSFAFIPGILVGCFYFPARTARCSYGVSFDFRPSACIRLYSCPCRTRLSVISGEEKDRPLHITGDHRLSKSNPVVVILCMADHYFCCNWCHLYFIKTRWCFSTGWGCFSGCRT